MFVYLPPPQIKLKILLFVNKALPVRTMSHTLWGELSCEKDSELEKNYPAPPKKIRMDELLQRQLVPEPKRNTLKVKNPLVTQTIEVMKQTEMLQSLIDTYSNKSGSSNYLVNPCQMIPEIDFPPENAADLVSEEKFQKPIWFIPTMDTPFSRGDPQPHAQITNNICRTALRKAVCGQLRVAGFTDTSESALVLFADAVEQFMKCFVQKLHHTDRTCQGAEERDLQVLHVEKAYFKLTASTVTQVHNYYKHNMIARNRAEIAEFNVARHEYDKLMKESQSMQKSSNSFNENDLLNILEMPSESNESSMAAVSDILQELGNSSASGGGSTSSTTNSSTICTNAATLALLDNQTNGLSLSSNGNGYITTFE